MTALDRTPSRRQLLAIGGAGAAALSLGAHAMALPPADTPVWAAFRRWADAHQRSFEAGITQDEQGDRLSSVATLEEEFADLPPVDARDLVCLGYVALHIADCNLEGDNAVLLRGDCNPQTLAFVSATMRAFPEVAAVILGETA